ncbi:hypothetical protein Tco_1342335 [Tanacetum coccineum]
MPSHAASASTRTNKGKCPLIPKKRGRPAKSSTSSSIGGSSGGATNKGGSRDGATSRGGSRGGATSRGSSRGISRGGSKGGTSKRGRDSSKKGRCSNTIPFQGLRDEASNEEHQFKMVTEAVYEMEREQMAIDEDDQYWEECAREFDHVKEHRAQDKGMPEDVDAGKQHMTKDVAAGKQPMIEDEPLQVGADLPSQESIVEDNPKPSRSKKSKAAEVPNQMMIFHKNKGRSERIFNQKMKNFKFDEHGTESPDKAFDVE